MEAVDLWLKQQLAAVLEWLNTIPETEFKAIETSENGRRLTHARQTPAGDFHCVIEKDFSGNISKVAVSLVGDRKINLTISNLFGLTFSDSQQTVEQQHIRVGRTSPKQDVGVQQFESMISDLMALDLFSS